MAMDFAKARQRARKLIASRKPAEQSPSALTDDPLRDRVVGEEIDRTERFSSLADNVPEVQYEHTLEDGSKETRTHAWEGFGDALTDIARASYQFGEPRLRPETDILASRQMNRELERAYMNTEDFQDSRAHTEGNAMESVFAGVIASRELQKAASEHLSEHISRSEEMGEAENASQDAQDLLDKLREQAKAEHEETGEVDPNLVDQIKEQTAQRQAARGKLEELLRDQAASDMAASVRAAAEQAAEATAKATAVMSSLPGMEPGQSRNLDPGVQIELAEKWASNKRLLELAEVIGRRFAQITRAREARTTTTAGEPVRIVAGRDLDKLLPHEMARMHIPAMRAGFIKDYAEHSLLQFQSEGRERLARGPLIPVIDGSGSMDGERWLFAKGTGLALFKIARKEHRDFAAVEFGSKTELKSWVFPGNEDPDAERVYDFATHFFGGGTSTVRGMREALRIIEQVPNFDTADVVLIGDGKDKWGDADEGVRSQLEKLGVRIHGLTVQTPNNPYFERMCDWHMDVADLERPDAQIDTLAKNLT